MKASGISSDGHVLIPIEHIRIANSMFVELDLQRGLNEAYKAETRLLRHEKGLMKAKVTEWEKRYQAQSELLRVSNVQVEQVVELNMELQGEIRRQRLITYGLSGLGLMLLGLAIIN